MRFKAIFKRFNALYPFCGICILKYKENKKPLFYAGFRSAFINTMQT